MDLSIRGHKAVVCAAGSSFIVADNLLLDGGAFNSSFA
jgi:hypothetical protein